jgi:hypothetical protein
MYELPCLNLQHTNRRLENKQQKSNTVKPVLRGHLCTVKPVLRGHLCTVKPVLRGHLCTVKPVLRGHLCTVKPVLRGHLLNKEKWSFKTDDLLKEVQSI